MSDRLIGLKEVENKVGFKKSKIYARIAQGEFPKPVKDGNQSLWSEAEVDELVEKMKSQRPQQSAAA